MRFRGRPPSDDERHVIFDPVDAITRHLLSNSLAATDKLASYVSSDQAHWGWFCASFDENPKSMTS